MTTENIKERWCWKLSTFAAIAAVTFFIVFMVVLLVTVFTKDQLRLSLQDGSPQACFMKSH